MAFSDFDLKTAVQTFALAEIRDIDLFEGVPPIEPGEFLRIWLDEFAPVALGVNSEKARSEFIIAPMLAAARHHVGSSVNVLPGVTFEVDKSQGLAGFCDFLVARSPEIYYVMGPVLAVVEAKKEDLVAGLGQCVAEMVAIRLFNEREGTVVPAVFGCVTSGNIWRFLKLEGPKNDDPPITPVSPHPLSKNDPPISSVSPHPLSKLFIDQPEYHLRNAAKILGILVSIARG